MAVIPHWGSNFLEAHSRYFRHTTKCGLIVAQHHGTTASYLSQLIQCWRVPAIPIKQARCLWLPVISMIVINYFFIPIFVIRTAVFIAYAIINSFLFFNLPPLFAVETPVCYVSLHAYMPEPNFTKSQQRMLPTDFYFLITKFNALTRHYSYPLDWFPTYFSEYQYSTHNKLKTANQSMI